MNAFHPLNVLVVLLVLLCVETSSFGSKNGMQTAMRCIESEREALLLFRQGVANEDDHLDSWNKEEEQDCCKWKGVGCHNRTGHVTHLLLSSLFSPSLLYTNSTGVTIGHSLLDLPYLTYLDLSSNYLERIPDFIGSFKKLVHLDCSYTWAGGSFPSQIGNLSNLQYLNLSFNSFDGPIPKSIGSLNSLRYLDLSYGGFTGVIPQELGNLSNLEHLSLGGAPSLGGNSFHTSPIPKFIGSLSNLRYLDLSSNSYVGVIPQELGNLSKLQHLDLSSYYNSYLKGGENFNWLLNLSSLTHLDLSGIEIYPPSIWPSFIQRIPSLSVLRLIGCNLSAPSSNVSNISSSISTLHLGYNRINSSIFNWIYHLSGSLVDLDLGMNDLEGRIPESFGHMTALTHLHLHENQLSGVLSKSFRNLSRLQVAGTFPLLQILDLSNNHLKGSLPDFTGFSSLELLYLYNNEFSGGVPDFTGCSSLRELQLGENQLTEWRTLSTRLLSRLEVLDLSMNSIRSTISEAHLSSLSSLKRLRTSSNSLKFEISSEWLPSFQLWELSLASCKLGPKFPNWIRNQRDIHHLDISNSQISDTIPIWFGNLSSSMELLNLSSNRIRGKFPLSKFPLITPKYFFQEIDLSSNCFDGPIPPIAEYNSKLNLSKNKFSGTLLFLSLLNESSLSFLDVSHNQLFGAIPHNWMHFQDLVFLNLGYNKFSGRIPMSIGHLVSLQTLILRNNKLYGELPASLRNCSNLGFVDFGLNKLSGKIPSWIGKDLPHLYALILKSNTFNGSLPNAICHLRNLHFLDLSINKISGTIPLCFGNLSAMSQNRTEVREHDYSTSTMNATVDYYVDNVLARWKGQEFEYGRNFAYLKMIDLSTNELTGEIPLGITKLLELKGLNLSGNRFYGKVPPEIGELKLLECLDLSTNKFSGEIPQSMSGLNFLAFLNLSNNNFSGKIPSGTQLQGFNISTYEGNTGLCGKPLTNTCPGEEPSDKIRPSIEYSVDEDNSEYERWLYISAILGFSTTFWGFIGTLVLNRRWRHAYFMFLHDLKERFYVAMAVRIARFQRKV